MGIREVTDTTNANTNPDTESLIGMLEQTQKEGRLNMRSALGQRYQRESKSAEFQADYILEIALLMF